MKKIAILLFLLFISVVVYCQEIATNIYNITFMFYSYTYSCNIEIILYNNGTATSLLLNNSDLARQINSMYITYDQYINVINYIYKLDFNSLIKFNTQIQNTLYFDSCLLTINSTTGYLTYYINNMETLDNENKMEIEEIKRYLESLLLTSNNTD